MHLKCPTLSKKQLISECKELGLTRGDTIMVHVSLRAVGEILGGPDVLIASLRETIGVEGTAMVYVGCQSPFDDIGRGIYTQEEEEFILAQCPPFEPDKARASRDFGAFAEFFRTTPGVFCSENPGCRMAAIGAKSEWLIKNHPLNYGLGTASPLEKLCDVGGKVVLIGSDLDAVTLLHYAEAIAPISEKKIVRIKVPLIRANKREWFDVEEYNSSTGICDWQDQFFAVIVQKYLQQHGRSGRIGQATTYVLNAKELVEFAVPIMVETAKELAIGAH
ncbi:MAG TPA: aminoglycoside 3-N-acetyltransferase [Oculatellaceae cyanobacterium]|jgi:aminoglycoside 3-N-acetyltransferase